VFVCFEMSWVCGVSEVVLDTSLALCLSQLYQCAGQVSGSSGGGGKGGDRGE
jgi:hypothetical protein